MLLDELDRPPRRGDLVTRSRARSLEDEVARVAHRQERAEDGREVDGAPAERDVGAGLVAVLEVHAADPRRERLYCARGGIAGVVVHAEERVTEAPDERGQALRLERA